jgi:AraC-like DNA-binding protein
MPEVPVTWIRHVVERVGPRSPIARGAFHAAGLSPRVLDDGTARIDGRQFVAFLDRAARLAQDGIFGLHMGQSYDLRASGLPAYTTLASGTMEQGFRNAIRYGAMNDTGARYALVTEGDGVRFEIESEDAQLRVSRHASEFKMAFIVAGMRRWIDEGFRPVGLRFAHLRVSSCREVERFFGCPVEFGCACTEMLLSPEQLALPVQGADPYLLSVLTRHADELMAARGPRQAAFRAKVERLALAALPRRVPTAGELAAELGVGERTFARRLAAEGVSFRQVFDDLRRDLARSYLADPELTLSEIAYLLGYAEQSAFTSAFRRWTGQSPRRYRGEATGDDAAAGRAGEDTPPEPGAGGGK